jgi:tetratricopeptide (TPR) repeat protein
MFMRDVAAALNLTLPPTTEGKIVLGLTWAATTLVGLLLLIGFLMLLTRRPPPGDDSEGRAPGWFRLFFAAVCMAFLQIIMAIIWVLFQPSSFSQADLAMQYTPRGVVLLAALAGLLALFYDAAGNAARRLARGQARLRGPFDTRIIGLLTPVEERVCTAYGRMAGRIWFLVPVQVLFIGGILVFVRQGWYLDVWPLILPFVFAWVFQILAFLLVNGALHRLNRRSLVVYCQELATLGRKWVEAVDGELRLSGLGLFQRLADLADVLGKERLQQSTEAVEAVAEARLVLAQASMEPGGEGIKDATQYLVGAVELRDLKYGEWLGLGWLLASDYVPESLLKDRARYGHFLLSYCRAWVAAQRQLQQKTPLSAAIKTNVRLGLVVSALEKRVCALAPVTTGQPAAAAGVGNAAAGEKAAPWRSDTFLPALAASPDVQLLLALNEAVVQIDGTLAWARLNAGLCRLAVGNAALARVHLEIAASQRRDDPTLPFYRAVAYAREKQSSEALALLEEVTEKELGWFLVVRTYAETLLEVFQTPLGAPAAASPGQTVSAERWKRARSIIERALLEEEMQARLQLPAAAPIYTAAGMAELFESRQPAQADVWFRRALGVDRQNAQGWYGLALASWEQGNYDAALQAAQEAMRYQVQHVPAATLCAHILMVRGDMGPALAMADQTLRLLNDPTVAQMRAPHHPQLYPEREVLLRVKGRAAFEQHHFDEAFAALDQVVRRYVDARFFAACSLYHLGRYAEATERLKDYLASKEGARDSRAFLYLGCSLHAQGPQNLRAALNALDSSLAGSQPGTPERLRALLERGQIYEERGQLEQAQRDYEEALEIERAPLTCYVLAALYHRAGRDQEAYTLLASLTGEGSSPQGTGALAQEQVIESAEAAEQERALAANTVILVQPNEPVEQQIQHLMGILRERLAAQAAQRAAEAEAAEQAKLERQKLAEAAAAPEQTPPEGEPAPEALDAAPAAAAEEVPSLPRKSKRSSTKPKPSAQEPAPAVVEQATDDAPTLLAEGLPEQIKRSIADEEAGQK